MDERRRRRLAQEAEPESPPDRRPAPRALSAHRTRRDAPVLRYQSCSPVETLVRPQLWVNVLLAVAGLSVSVGAVWLGVHVDTSYPSLAASLGLQNGLLGRSLVAFYFLLAAQMSYVCLWYRTRSRKDFRGQYKVWCWVGPTWVLFALASAIDGRFLIQELLLPQFSVRIWHAETLCWLVPSAVLVLTTTRFLLHDMREDRWGTMFLWLSLAASTTAALVVLSGPLLGIDLAAKRLLEQGSLNVWALASLLSMLFHARYVIHVTNEAPHPRERGRFAAILRQLLPRLPRRVKSRRGTAADTADSCETGPRDGENRSETREEGHPSELMRRIEPAEQPAPPPVASTADAASERNRDTADEPTPEDDDSHDQTTRLSKKQLRKLRKQRRIQQRAGQPRL